MSSSVSSSSRRSRFHLSAARLGNAWPAYRAFSLRIEATRFRCAALSFAMAAGPSAWRLLLSHLGLGLTSFTFATHYPLRGLPFKGPTRSARHGGTYPRWLEGCRFSRKAALMCSGGSFA
jgi:hypothetical protein